MLTNTLAPKQLQFLHEVAPTAKLVGFLANPKNPAAESDVREVKSAATTTGQQILTVNAGNDGEFDTAFTDHLVRQHAGALLVMADPFLHGGKILKGAQPADLPVQQSVKVQFVLNLKTAKTLGLTVPTALLTTAGEVIE